MKEGPASWPTLRDLYKRRLIKPRTFTKRRYSICICYDILCGFKVWVTTLVRKEKFLEIWIFLFF